MSETHNTRRARRGDGGFTLPELLVTITVLGAIVAVLSSALIVTLRQSDNTEGRLNVARGEQNVGMVLPSDLASARTVNTAANASPCSVSVSNTAGCPADVIAILTGSNTMMFTWTTLVAGSPDPVEVIHNVSYHYHRLNDEWVLSRIECVGSPGNWTCGTSVVLHNLDGPPNGTPWIPGTTEPWWIVEITEPLDPDAISEDDLAGLASTIKEANRVVVTINGGGDSGGAGGGVNQISVTAGGTVRTTIPPGSMVGTPTFTEARSRCGGNIALVMDISGSLSNANVLEVKKGARKFVETFAGAPVRIQLITFSTASAVLGTSEWSKYFDMTKPTDVTDALAVLADTYSWGSRGYTNWEDGLYRALRNPDGQVHSDPPGTVLFFTDGIPNTSRQQDRDPLGAAPGALPTDLVDGDWNNGEVPKTEDFWYEAYHRANYWVTVARNNGTKFIGVGVGSFLYEESDFVLNGKAPYDWSWERGSHRYQRGYQTIWEQAPYNYEERAVWDWEEKPNWDEEYWDGNSWENSNKTTYHQFNTNPGESDGWRRDDPSGSGWDNMTQAQFNANNTDNDSDDGVRRKTPSGGWVPITQAWYNINNDTNDETDGVRRTPTTTWGPITQAAYNAGNSTSDETDGYRTRKVYDSGTYTGWEDITAAAYGVGNTTPDSLDGWRDIGKTYTSPYLDWEPTAKPSGSANPNSPPAGYRTFKVFAPIATAPYDGIAPVQLQRRENWEILGDLISVTSSPVLAEQLPVDTGPYTNALVAEQYNVKNWDQFAAALEAVALAKCGGTLTMQTKVAGVPAGDEFQYVNTLVTDQAGVVTEPNKIVRTSARFISGTFDFPTSGYVTVQVEPTELSTLDGYLPAAEPWTCRSRNVTFVPTTYPLVGSTYTGIRLEIRPNQAFACTLNVTLGST